MTRITITERNFACAFLQFRNRSITIYLDTLGTVFVNVTNRLFAFPVDFAHSFEFSFEMFSVIREIVYLHARFHVIRRRDAFLGARDWGPAFGTRFIVVPNEAFVQAGIPCFPACESGV